MGLTRQQRREYVLRQDASEATRILPTGLPGPQVVELYRGGGPT